MGGKRKRGKKVKPFLQFEKFPYEMNEMILQYLDPISLINFGKTSKFCYGLAENFDDRIVEIEWNVLTDESNGQDVLKFKVEKSPDILYILDVKKEPKQITSRKRRFTQVNEENPTNVSSSTRNKKKDASILSSRNTLLILKRFDKSSNTTVECWKQKINGNCLEFILQYFFDLLKRNQNSIKFLSSNFEGNMSKKLQSIFPKNLEKCYVKYNNQKYTRNKTTWFSRPLYLDEVCRIKSSILSFSSVAVTCETFKEYLILWRDGKLHENLKKIEYNHYEMEAMIFQAGFSVKIGGLENTPEGLSQSFEIVKTCDVNYRLIGNIVKTIRGIFHGTDIIIEKHVD